MLLKRYGTVQIFNVTNIFIHYRFWTFNLFLTQQFEKKIMTSYSQTILTDQIERAALLVRFCHYYSSISLTLLWHAQGKTG
jgi:hypothetical protein